MVTPARQRWSTPDLVDHAHRQFEQELADYFAAGDVISPPSNFGRMVAAIGARAESAGKSESWHVVTITGSQGMRANEQATEVDERMLRALDELRPIRRCLAALTGWRQDVLAAACKWDGRSGVGAFGARAGLAPLTMAARRAHLESHTTKPLEEWLQCVGARVCSGAGAPERFLAKEIASEALALWRDAFSGFCAARARWQRMQWAKEHAARELCAAEGRRWGAFDERERA
jgi:hypothetical protein